jgi:hypothetical protein
VVGEAPTVEDHQRRLHGGADAGGG